MPDTDTAQLNVLVPRDVDDALEELGKRFDWSKREAATLAIHALKALMDAHTAYAAQLEDDIGDLYMRLAREAPAAFVEAPKDGIRVGRAGELPAVLVDKWLVFPDRETGALLAEEQGGEGRIARIIDGEIKPLKMPSPGEVALN
jgi:hypothetical protein